MMTTNQLPLRQCRYCGSDDLGLGWQHGEGIVTFKKHGILGNRMRCLICRRCGAVLFQWVAEPHSRWEGRIVIGHKEKGGRLVTGDTKTYAGTRTIVLPDSTAELLRCRKKNSYSVWIFPNPIKPEAPMNPSTAYHQLKKLLEENGPPDLRFHDLRHTFATYALANGVDPKTLSGILGHTKASFTVDTYTHTTTDMHKKAAEIVGGFLTDYLGEEMAPWQSAEPAATAVST